MPEDSISFWQRITYYILTSPWQHPFQRWLLRGDRETDGTLFRAFRPAIEENPDTVSTNSSSLEYDLASVDSEHSDGYRIVSDWRLGYPVGYSDNQVTSSFLDWLNSTGILSWDNLSFENHFESARGSTGAAPQDSAWRNG